MYLYIPDFCEQNKSLLITNHRTWIYPSSEFTVIRAGGRDGGYAEGEFKNTFRLHLYEYVHDKNFLKEKLRWNYSLKIKHILSRR